MNNVHISDDLSYCQLYQTAGIYGTSMRGNKVTQLNWKWVKKKDQEGGVKVNKSKPNV